ncbi:MAG TPA: class I SAM-dependent methyltransferase [Desulfobulbus sp.]|nr:class I SAM-dependent methyltransferase [Desulfobulbus sp.]
MKTDTAHQHWNVQWSTKEGRADWIEPDIFVVEFVSLMRSYGVTSVLDLGCGPGRHALFLAEMGFQVRGIDASPAAVSFLEQESEKLGLDIKTTISEMTNIGLADNSCDMVLAWNVIYHGDIPVVQRSLSEIGRVLQRGGLFVGTMLSRRNSEVQTGSEIAHNTYTNTDKSDKDHPHFYCNAAELIGLFHGFEPIILQDTEQKEPGSGAYHWQFIMEKQ